MMMKNIRFIALWFFAVVLVLSTIISFPSKQANAAVGDFPPNPLAKPGYQLYFNNEFGGSSIDTNKWVDAYLPHWSNRTQAAPRYNFNNGSLVLRIDQDQQYWSPFDGVIKSSAIMSGEYAGPLGSTEGLHNFKGNNTVLETQQNGLKFESLYGYYELRAKGNIGSGNHLAWWMVGYETSPEKSAEIDIIEAPGGQMASSSFLLGHGVHAWDDTTVSKEYYFDTIQSDAKQFHIYGFEWTPNQLKFYVDNVLVRTINKSIQYSMVHIINIYENENASGFPWGPFDPNYTYPKQFEIDYFRAYQPVDQYYLIKNRWTGQYLNVQNQTGKVEVSSVPSAYWSGQWKMENTGDGHFRLKNRYLGQLGVGSYMHNEDNLGYVQYGQAQTGWLTAQWSLENVKDTVYKRLKNSTGYVHNENKLGYAQYGSVPSTYWSSQWEFVPVQ
ncbi:family 16 glycosylhydrolase [Cohnella silvisoli]|uniref:Family 16 glycosylhydrolase n=1 Tax=Cohnella silvisoli TaxID=2873699 RepID=A0ABV1KSI2_9BACL|nr:family 16 glycosylhydrolase [Cohnella silvisoli]MCD9022644.1 family 16 glycosylhydrolase [Cohnella silvisoli]